MGTPLHLGVMPGVIRAILASYPVAQMQPGDVYGTNLPYPEGPGHLPDLSLVSPIFHDEQPIALAASTAHHVDMGATHPAACRALPDGTYQFENCLDDDGVTDEPVKIAVAIRVAGDDGVHTHLTNTRNAAVEVIESTYPLYSLLFGSLSSRSLRHTRTTWTWASARR